jgi:4-diphosphocytidyl-2-C-methyl-D-erythritol kinase
MLIFPNCKINLGLSVEKKRSDGFHNIDTILFPVPLTDILEIIPSPDHQFSFTQSGNPIPGLTENNLVIKAYRILQKEYHLPEVHIHLYKNIPLGAGLGGGSANAAYCIKLLNILFELNLTSEKMEGFAKTLGSDCAFFINNKAVQAKEKGDLFTSVKIDLSEYHIVIVHPKIHISTPKAYSWVTPKKKDKSVIEIIQKPVKHWKDILINDFEEAVFKQHIQVKQIKEKLYQLGATYASMSGSGSAVFGLFEKEYDVKKEFPEYFTWQSKL